MDKITTAELCVLMLYCFVIGADAEGTISGIFEEHERQLEDRISNDVKEYVSRVIEVMAQTHNRDIRYLKGIIKNLESNKHTFVSVVSKLGKRIENLESDKHTSASVISKLENRIENLESDKYNSVSVVSKLDKRIENLETDKRTYASALSKLESRMVHIEWTIVNSERVRQENEDLKANHFLPNDETDDTEDTQKGTEHEADTNGVINQSFVAAITGNKTRVRRANVEQQVAFFASVASTTAPLGVNQDIAFDHVVTNIGNAYNGHHGTFLAPTAGVYVFSVTLHSMSAHSYGHFVVNGAIIAKLHIDYYQVSQTVVVLLKPGDDVSIQNPVMGKSIQGDRYSTFSGYLLYDGTI